MMDALAVEERILMREGRQPQRLQPTLATLTEKRRGTGRIMGDTYRELVEVLSGQDVDDCVVDGEVVAFRRRPDLIRRMQVSNPVRARSSRIAVYWYLFDLIHLDGFDLSRLPLLHANICRVRSSAAGTRYGSWHTHQAEHGEAYYRQA